VLTITTGSSSLKAALYHLDTVERADVSATAERIGQPECRLRIADAASVTLSSRWVAWATTMLRWRS
jgi:acetate kinase